MRKLFPFRQSLIRVALVGAAIVSLETPLSVQTRRGTPVVGEATIRSHMEFLASDAMNGRGSGTEDEWRAAAYIAAQLRRFGVEPLGDGGGFLQQIPNGRVIATRPPLLTFEDELFVHGQQMLVTRSGSRSVAGPLVTYSAGSEVPAGAFLLVPRDIAENASMSRAAAILVRETPQIRSGWADSGTRMPVGSLANPSIAPPPVRIVLSADLHDRLSLAPPGSPVSFTLDARPTYTWNVVGQLRGSDRTDREEVILLTAHLDHLGVRGSGPDTIFNGADDDASGTTAVLALAEAIAGGSRPDRTVMFAWFGSEEAGGVGARRFLESPPVPLDRIVANIEFEMIGRPDSVVPPRTLWLTGYERSDLGPALARRGARLVADPHPDQRFFTRSDNIQLACRGVVAQTISSFGLHKEYHTAADDLSHIDFTHMTDAINSVIRPVLWLANANFKPAWLPGKKPEPGNPCR